ncbi:MAG TPA: hypothetical protein VG755_07500 [Nannocystaceae bacterium]|nr:hypothetical protein [Nannocystaceae bacterium]
MALAWWIVVGAALQSSDVRWVAPAECPDVAEVQALVDRRIGRPLAEGELAIDGRVEADGDAYRLELVLARDGAQQSRVIEATECGALARVTALVAGLAVDAVAIAEQERAVLVPAPVATAPQTAEPRAPTRAHDSVAVVSNDRVRSPAPRRPQLQLLLAIVGGIERGAMPSVTGGIDVAIGVRARGFRVELAGTWLGPRRREITGAAVNVQLGTVAVRGCPELALARVSVPLCVGVEVGAMRGAGELARFASTEHGLWVAPTIGTGVRVGRGRVAFVGRGEVAIAAQRPAFDVDGTTRPIGVFLPAPVSARLWLGVEFRLPR